MLSFAALGAHGCSSGEPANGNTVSGGAARDTHHAQGDAPRTSSTRSTGGMSPGRGSGVRGPGGSITLGQPHTLIFQPNSHILFVADPFAGRVIRMDTATGEAAVFAGRGTQVAAGAGTIYCLAFDPAGENLYLSAGGVTVINVQTKAVQTPGMPTPGILALDAKKNLYEVIGRYGTALRVVDAAGAATNVMGGGGLAGPKGMAI